LAKHRTAAGFALVLAVCVALRGPERFRFAGDFRPRDNPQIAEAQAWWDGRMSLAERYWDTALVDGRVYTHFPPLFSIVSAIFVPFSEGVPRWAVFWLVVVPIPLLAYLLFLQCARSPLPAATMTIGLVCGTSLWPVMNRVLVAGSPWFVNQALATIGNLLFLLDYTGRRRIWLGAVGLVLAGLSRQLTVFYFPALIALASRGGHGANPGERGRISSALIGLSAVLAVTGALNTLKFGRPWDSGYMHIYEGRDDPLCRDARTYGIFSFHYVPRNLYYANVGAPQRVGRQNAWRPNPHGTGIWWTTPLLIWLLINFRRLWADRDARWLMLCSAAVFVALMCYHSTGYAQRGYNRYSLDYVPVWLALIGPGCFQGRRRWISLAMILWSVWYFAWVI